jgi:PhnB protein
MAKSIPDGYHSVTPMFVFKDVRKAIDFYKKAFGATEKFVMPGPNGKGVMHAELKIGDSIIMMGEESTSTQHQCKSAESFGGSPISVYLYVKDADAAFKKAIEAGATSKMPVQEMFWGDRMGAVSDPFGYSWSLATHTKDLSPKEIEEGAKAAFAQKTAKK